MARQTVFAAKAPAAVGPYVHAVKAGNTVYTSGQLGLIPATGVLPEGIEAQAKQAMENLKAVIEAAGMTMGDIVKTTVFLADMDDFAAVNAVYAEHFQEPFPARSCVQVAAIPKGCKLEIECIAVK